MRAERFFALPLAGAGRIVSTSVLFLKAVREEYLRQANKIIKDPNILINVVSHRVHQLQHQGMMPLIESLEKLEPEDIALREIIEGKLSYELSADEHSA